MECSKALKIAWFFYSALALSGIVITVVLPADFILNNTPTCYSIKQSGHECFMCGSTRSFILLSRGKFMDAFISNKLGAILFFLIIVNSIIAAFHIVKFKSHEKTN
ncbi:hypothetical protein CHU92_11470 [Flavobacterium cyanobacteriorum]|uniref:DUF2752 domain-containing protein n=1 Tax=Flavobacterium cyanobacteriorum TaxID=2022802 RepID=A0A255YZP2_9FLAO|nr:hypothetical protein CHU92_11470 [Flavobacterium cyanobacteriorum]